MLAVTRRTDYALITLAHLAGDDEGVSSAREMADRYHLPPAMVTNVLKSLCQAGLIESERGPRGGYRLRVPAEHLSILRVMEAVEGPFRLVQCASPEGSNGAGCDVQAWCPIQSPILRLHGAVREYLNKVTIADICRERPSSALVQAQVSRE